MPIDPLGTSVPPRTPKLDLTAPKADATPAPAPGAAPASPGWSASNRAGSVPAGAAPAPSASAEAIRATLPNPVREHLEGAVDRYTARLEKALNHDAMSIATGRPPVREGDPLTPDQAREVQAATVDLIKDIPLGALSSDIASAAQRRLADAGLKAPDLASARLGDLGSIGGDIAKDLAKDAVDRFKAASPTAYYSIAAGAAAAVGYTAWEGGSAKLSRLGIKPQLEQSLFDGKLAVKLGPEWQAHFKDFGTTAAVTGKADLGRAGRLEATVSGSTRTGLDSATLDYRLTRPDWTLSATATADREGLRQAGARFDYRANERFNLSAGVSRDARAERTTADVSATWKARKDVDLALSGRFDSKGESRVGVGVRVSF